jgi:site-specific DNA-adenine methylase
VRLALCPYFGGKVRQAPWIVSVLKGSSRRVETWIEAFGGGLSVALAACHILHPSTLVIAERIPALRRAYDEIRTDPAMWNFRWSRLTVDVRDEERLRALVSEPEDGDSVRYVAAVASGWARLKGTFDPKHFLALRAPSWPRRFLAVSAALRIPRRVVLFRDYRETSEFSGPVYADPPYVGKGIPQNIYGGTWKMEDDVNLANFLTQRDGPALVSTFSASVYEERGFDQVTPPRFASSVSSSIYRRRVELSIKERWLILNRPEFAADTNNR